MSVPLALFVPGGRAPYLDEAELAEELRSIEAELARIVGRSEAGSAGGPTEPTRERCPRGGPAARGLSDDELDFVGQVRSQSAAVEFDVRPQSDRIGDWLLVSTDIDGGGFVADTLRLDFDGMSIRGGWSPGFLSWDHGVRAAAAAVDFVGTDGIALYSPDRSVLASAAAAWFDSVVSGWPSSDRAKRWRGPRPT